MALGLRGGLRIAYPWVGRSRMWRIERATAMSTRQRPAQPVAPMSDQAWHRVLVEAGLVERPDHELGRGASYAGGWTPVACDGSDD